MLFCVQVQMNMQVYCSIPFTS